jgi:hypothetical protein
MLKLLRELNQKRQAVWPGACVVDLPFRGLELADKAGAVAGAIKGRHREAFVIAGNTKSENLGAHRAKIAGELAHLIICADLVAMELDIDLGEAIAREFNDTSRRVGLDVMFVDLELMQGFTTFLVGPAACGKTRNSAVLAAGLGSGSVIDGWYMGDPVTPGALHIATPSMRDYFTGPEFDGYIGNRAITVVEYSDELVAACAARVAGQ